ncbi:class I SAM-dependent methyltransferase [Haladaptatus sp. DYF46]|uniref:class I SAM-dependent methyltransferase n=1 Tax=Haladaptatus sp. DYF46 TaxID=2886041 RepID=UPI001E5E0C08
MNFQTYLDAKRTVDDRALNRRVLGRFSDELPESARILEIGAGIGAMVERLHSWNCLPPTVRYTALDIDPENVRFARKRLLSSGFEPHGDELRLTSDDRRLAVDFEVADAETFAAETDERWDALVGHAIADLFDLDSALPVFRSILEPGGLCYFPITFDGGTTFDPPHPLDARVERVYHRDMGNGSGTENAGRRLLSAMRGEQFDLLAAGSSDWLVYPSDGSYPVAEARFLRFILDIVAGVLADNPDIDSDAFADWLRTRHEQVEEGELTYIAHQFDVLGRRT